MTIKAFTENTNASTTIIVQTCSKSNTYAELYKGPAIDVPRFLENAEIVHWIMQTVRVENDYKAMTCRYVPAMIIEV